MTCIIVGMDDTSDTPIHRIVIRVAVPPATSAVLPLDGLQQQLEKAGLVVLGIRASREDETAESDPSALP